MKLKDYDLSESFSHDYWYVDNLPVPIGIVGCKHLDGNISREQDRQIITAMNRQGKRSLLYHDHDGFKIIKIKVKPIG